MSKATEMFSNQVPTTRNHDGYPAYERSLEERYLQTLLTNTVSNTYYSTKDELAQETEAIHSEMVKANPAFVAKALPFARQEGYMRLQPIYGLAKLAGADTELFKRAFPGVILVPSDLQDFFTILKGFGRGEGGRAIKKTVAEWLNQNLSEYWAIKYNGQGRGYSLGDIVKTVHPKNADKNILYKYLIGKAEDFELPAQLFQYQLLKAAKNTADQISAIRFGRLPHEVVTGAVDKMTPELWNALLSSMPVFALLRNLNTLDRAGVLNQNQSIIMGKMTNPEVLAKSKILPFRFLNAFNAVSSGWARDMLRQGVELTFGNLPEIAGRTAIFLDVSSSMSGENLTIGSVFALALFKKTQGNALFWLFNMGVAEFKASMVDSILSQAAVIRANGGTDTGRPVKTLIDRNERVDNIIMITDEQQNTGSSFFRNLQEYRRRMNPNARAFIINVAATKGSMAPVSDKLSHMIYGWSDQVLQYIAFASTGYGSMVSRITGAECLRASCQGCEDSYCMHLKEEVKA